MSAANPQQGRPGSRLSNIRLLDDFHSALPRANIAQSEFGGEGRRFFLTCLVIPAFAAAQDPHAAHQQAAPSPLSKDEIVAYTKAELAISTARDSMQAQFAMARNKKTEVLQSLREKLRLQIDSILKHAGMTQADYDRKTYIVSSDNSARHLFDSVVVALTGAPLPGTLPPGPVRVVVAVPAGPVGTHIGHVVNAFGDTPMNNGLLPTAMAEARTASQHATLGVRNPANLDAMKLHAGHVINALDPTIVTAGPGLGYGLKKAALGVANHIDLAAKAPGASVNVQTHANHIATCARNTIVRADSMIAIAKRVQAATDAPAAAALMNQLVSLGNQLVAGFDANADGRITTQEGEGGLQQAEEHVQLMLAGEPKPAR
jgi:hypothetical protein